MIFCISQSRTFADEMDKAVERYRYGYFEEAAETFKAISEKKGKEQPVSLVYLALIEIAYRNQNEAEKYILRLIKSNPAFKLESVEDATPELQKMFDRIMASVDIQPPEGMVSGIDPAYVEGKTVYYTVRANDDRDLKKIVFEVKKQSVRESWHVRGKSVTHKSFFHTAGWAAGTYSYSLLIEDSAGNSGNYDGSFKVDEKPDTNSPEGEIAGLRDSYIQGDMIVLTLRTKDDKSLKKVSFSVADSSVKESRDVSGRSDDHKITFSTEKWRPGTYPYTFVIEDRANNKKKYTGNIILKEKQYGFVNIFTRPWATIFIDGKSYGHTPIGKLKLPAGDVRIQFVNKSMNINETRTITIEPNKVIRKHYEWK